eukprot:m.179479 g.179479  ORF g.179479 m.179479 type:complete len:355 (+) comp17991_c0_seq2:176-1240(+)
MGTPLTRWADVSTTTTLSRSRKSSAATRTLSPMASTIAPSPSTATRAGSARAAKSKAEVPLLRRRIALMRDVLANRLSRRAQLQAENQELMTRIVAFEAQGYQRAQDNVDRYNHLRGTRTSLQEFSKADLATVQAELATLRRRQERQVKRLQDELRGIEQQLAAALEERRQLHVFKTRFGQQAQRDAQLKALQQKLQRRPEEHQEQLDQATVQWSGTTQRLQAQYADLQGTIRAKNHQFLCQQLPQEDVLDRETLQQRIQEEQGLNQRLKQNIDELEQQGSDSEDKEPRRLDAASTTARQRSRNRTLTIAGLTSRRRAGPGAGVASVPSDNSPAAIQEFLNSPLLPPVALAHRP